MTSKEQAESLVEALKDAAPNVIAKIDSPERPHGSWFIDITGRIKLVVEIRLGQGYGISLADNMNFGEGPDIILPTEEQAVNRICELLHQM